MKPRPALAASSWTAVAAVVLAVAAPDQTWLRFSFGLPLVMLLPGYGLVRAAYPAREPDRVRRFTLSVGLSIVVAVATGLALDLAGIGLGRYSWTLALAGVTLAANAAAATRTARAVDTASRAPAPKFGVVAPAVLAALVLVLAIAVSAPDARRAAGGDVVQLWALGPSETGPRDVTIGMSNKVSNASYFHLLILHADTVLADKSVYLPVGRTMTFSVRIPPDASLLTPVRAVLTPQEPGGRERTVVLWPSEMAASAGRR